MASLKKGCFVNSNSSCVDNERVCKGRIGVLKIIGGCNVYVLFTGMFVRLIKIDVYLNPDLIFLKSCITKLFNICCVFS
mgnify:CR=1 FL=1